MLIITGTYPPERCGVGDYTQCLLSTETGGKWHLFYRKHWQLGELGSLCKALRKTTDKVVNLQYPTMGYSTNITPHLLALYAVVFLRRKLILTIHEYSQLGWKGKLALKPLFALAATTVFTTDFELRYAKRRNPLLRRGAVIKIGSNIPAAEHDLRTAVARAWDLGYFGYLRPNKGLEEFLSVAERLKKERKDAGIYVMGQTQPEFAAYHTPIVRRLGELGIVHFADKNKEEAAELLNDTKIAYLHYPDGLSERRGSFLASAVNGCVVVSSEGAFTTEEQKRRIILADANQAYGVICDLLNDETKLCQAQDNVLAFVKDNVPPSWESVAGQYKNIIDSL